MPDLSIYRVELCNLRTTPEYRPLLNIWTEILTPLTVLFGYTDLAITEAQTLSSEQAQNCIQACNKIHQLIREILDLIRLYTDPTNTFIALSVDKQVHLVKSTIQPVVVQLQIAVQHLNAYSTSLPLVNNLMSKCGISEDSDVHQTLQMAMARIVVMIEEIAP